MRLRVLSDLHLEFYDAPERAGIRDNVDCTYPDEVTGFVADHVIKV